MGGRGSSSGGGGGGNKRVNTKSGGSTGKRTSSKKQTKYESGSRVNSGQLVKGTTYNYVGPSVMNFPTGGGLTFDRPFMQPILEDGHLIYRRRYRFRNRWGETINLSQSDIASMLRHK